MYQSCYLQHKNSKPYMPLINHNKLWKAKISQKKKLYLGSDSQISYQCHLIILYFSTVAYWYHKKFNNL